MFGSIISKELLKLRMFLVGAVIFNAGIVTYIYLIMNKLFRLDHSEVVWYYTIHLGEIFYEPFRYIPAVTGIFLAVAQFLPEIRSHRFRISLHLPVQTHTTVFAHVLVGFLAMVILFTADAVFFTVMTASKYPHEYTVRMLITLLPWIIAGFTAYTGTTLVMLEPVWRVRFINLLVSACITGLFVMKTDAGSYSGALFWMVLPAVLFVPAVLLPAYRFRYRRS